MVTEDTFHDSIRVKVFDFWFHFMEKTCPHETCPRENGEWGEVITQRHKATKNDGMPPPFSPSMRGTGGGMGIYHKSLCLGGFV